MSRQEMLQRLLEKAEKGNEYIYSQFSELSQSFVPPATIKRMQILPMGLGRINAPTPINKDSIFFQKNVGSNNRRVFILQKSKKLEKGQQKNSVVENGAKCLQRNISNNERQINRCESPVPRSEQKANSPSERTTIQSPTRVNSLTKPSFWLTDAMKNSSRRAIQYSFKSERNQPQKLDEIRMSSSTKLQYSQKKISFHKGIGKGDYMDYNTALKDAEQAKRNKIMLRKQINKNYQRAFEAPPKITSKSYVVYQIESSQQNQPIIKIHTAFNSKIKVQIASLTKIMTCILVIELCHKFNVCYSQQKVKMGKFESGIGGTTAHIQQNQIYTVEDLLHGLMLPSGNDASLALAVWAGRKLLEEEEKQQKQIAPLKRLKKQCYQRFITQMNKKASQIGMLKTNYANSHGLINLLNRSCAHDVAVLSHYCMKNQTFRRIVSCKQYRSTITVENEDAQNIKPIVKKSVNPQSDFFDEEDKQLQDDICEQCDEAQNVEIKKVITFKEVIWENTHKLLQKNSKQYLGIKTGVTTAAGPCLSSCVQSTCGRRFYIVVLNSKKLQLRFKQTEILKKWVFKKEGIIKKSKVQTTCASKSTKSELENFQSQSQSEQEEQSQIINGLQD